MCNILREKRVLKCINNAALDHPSRFKSVRVSLMIHNIEIQNDQIMSSACLICAKVTHSYLKLFWITNLRTFPQSDDINGLFLNF